MLPSKISTNPNIQSYWYGTIDTLIKAYNEDNYIQLSIEDYIASALVRAYQLGYSRSLS